MNHSTHILDADRLSLRLGERLLFDQLSLSISAGDVLAVTGPSGAGKSSLLRCLSGEISAEGKVSRHARVGEIPQALALNEELPAWENVALARFLQEKQSFFGSLLPAGALWRKKSVDAMRALGLRSPNVKTAKLSGGEKQRLAAARALLADWRLLLADEPISQLDETNSRLVLTALKEEAKRRNGALILVLHHEGLAKEYSSRTLQLGGSR